jgi:hypothetical protein
MDKIDSNPEIDLVCHTIIFTLHIIKTRNEGPLKIEQLRAMVGQVLEPTMKLDDEMWTTSLEILRSKGLIDSWKED